jgi:hypothetical protein
MNPTSPPRTVLDEVITWAGITRQPTSRSERKGADVLDFCRALFRTRTGDPLLTMEVLYQLS